MSKQIHKIGKNITCLLFLVLFFISSAFSEQTTPFRVETGPIPEKVNPGETFSIEIIVDMESGYHLYAKNTRLAVPTVPGLSFSKIISPRVTEIGGSDGPPFAVYSKEAIFELPVRVNPSLEPGKKELSLTLAYQGCSDKMCFMPEKKTFNISFSVVQAQTSPQKSVLVSPISESRQKPSENNQDLIQKTAKRFGFMGVLLIAFIWGIFASLTPCVYPMIPVTISVIGAGSSKSISKGFMLSVVYVLGMSIIYSSFGVAAAWSGSLFGSYINHPAVRIIVAIIFIFLGLSMFDLFFIQTPSAISSKIGTNKRSGIFGVFLAGGAAGAVVGPCVGPMLVGLLIYIAALGSKLSGFLIMWSFSLGMGILFLVIGTLSGAVKTLPKAGGWMENIKYIMGLFMFAIALYYLMPVMDKTLFNLLMIAFLIGIGIFIGATLKPKTSPMGKSRILYAGGIFLVSIGIAYVAGPFIGDSITIVNGKKPGIIWLDDEAAALKLAKDLNKPVMMDFSAEWCKACKDLEKISFQHPDVVNDAKRFVTLRIDSTDPKKPEVARLLKKYSVIGLPTIVFTASNGNILKDKTITEFVKPKELLNHMQLIE